MTLWLRLREWISGHPAFALGVLTVAVLSPQLNKPFNIDEPLFIWAARNIQTHPGDPYGFKVNWYGTIWPMADVTKNPPLACYYLAVAGSIQRRRCERRPPRSTTLVGSGVSGSGVSGSLADRKSVV